MGFKDQFQETDLARMVENVKRASQGLPPLDPKTGQPASVGMRPGQTIVSEPVPPSEDEKFIAANQAANLQQAQTDPAMAAKLARTQAAAQQFYDKNSGIQSDKLDAIIKKKKALETYPAEEQ